MLDNLNVHKKRFPNDTRLNADFGDGKRIRMNEFVADLLADISNELNKKFTQGMVSYEYLLMTRSDVCDPIDEYEEIVDDQLSDLGVKSSRVNEITYANRIDERDEHDDKKRRNIWVASDINADWETWNDKVEQAIIDGYNSVFTDRFERIKVKRDLVQILSNPSQDTSDVCTKAEKIYYLDEEYDIADELEQKMDYTIESRSDYYNTAHVLTSWDDRFRLLDKLLQNKEFEFEELVNFVKDCHDLGSKGYVRRKLKEFAREYPEHKHLIEDYSTAFEPDQIERDPDVNQEVKVGNFTFIYQDHKYRLEEVLYRLVDNNGGSIKKSTLKKIWNRDFDKDLVEFVEELEHLAYASKSKKIYTIDAFPEKYI
jgi:hypothetical protein